MYMRVKEYYWIFLCPPKRLEGRDDYQAKP